MHPVSTKDTAGQPTITDSARLGWYQGIQYTMYGDAVVDVLWGIAHANRGQSLLVEQADELSGGDKTSPQ